MRNAKLFIAAALLAAGAAVAHVADTLAAAPIAATIVSDEAALARLRGNSGITLQWIGWDERGQVAVADRGDTVHISGAQLESGGPGYLMIDGDIEEIGSNYFIFNGIIEIVGTPDAGRSCRKTGRSHFAITQNRRYWRLIEFEWCDILTDYIDIYF